MEDNSLQEVANAITEFDLNLTPTSYSENDFRNILSAKINELVNTNFSKLVGILYRLDISEKKLKELLANTSDTPAGDVITSLIIERQLEKIESRKTFKQNNDISDSEKW